MIWVLAAVVVLGCATPAFAQAEAAQAARDEEAHALFEAGRVAYEDGRYEDALGYFERSYQLSQRPGLQYNLGLAYDRLRRDREALQAFETYLAEGPDPMRQQEVENRVRALRSVLARQEEEAQSVSAQPQPQPQVQPQPQPQPQLQPPPTLAQPERDRARDHTRKRRIWIGIASGIVAVGVGAVVAWAVAHDQPSPRPAPNSGVTIEALSWH